MPFPDLNAFAFSFSHAVLKANGRAFTGVSGVRVDQQLQDAPVYGTERGPLKRSAGQLQMGAGQLTFGDFQDGTDFFQHLSPDPYMRLWTLEYTLVLENEGAVRTIECQSCRLLGTGIDHNAGPEALSITFPFSFLKMRINGIDLALSPRALLNAGVGIANNLINLL